ncbi:hypothetical protein BU17DRAFT_68869 [Hysterangium stoloniferum]|nr:hypothetical protein BU17DRAFT_68869 [Hysterangium stoloniferum]
MPISAPSASTSTSTSSHLPNRPTLRPLLSSFPAPPSHIPASPATVSPPAFTHGLSTVPNGLVQQMQMPTHSSSAPAPASAHSRPGPPPLGPLPPLPTNTSPISLEEQKQIAFLKIRESWHSRYSSESGASVSPSLSDESGEEEEGVAGSSSTTATSVENPESSLNRQRHLHLHLHQKQAEERADIAVDAYPINNAHVDSPVSPTSRQFDTPLTLYPQDIHSIPPTATQTRTTTGMTTSAQENNPLSLSRLPSPTPSTRTSSPDIQTLIRSRSCHNLRKGKGQSRGRKSMPSTLRFASAEEAARLYRARSTPSLSLSMSLEGGDDRAFGDGSDVDRDGDADMGKSMAVRMNTEVDWADDPDAELDLEDDLDLEADMDSEDDVIDLKTPLPHLMLRLGLLSPHSKLLPRMTPSPEPQARGRDASLERDVARMSPVGSMFSTLSKHPRDARDTEKRRQRHKDGRLLRGGIGLTTGLGWSDSEDEDAPSELTDRLSRLAPSLSRKSSMAVSTSGYSHHVIVAAEAETAVVVIVLFVRVELPSAYLSPFAEEGAFTPTWTRTWCEEGVGWAGIWIWIGAGAPLFCVDIGVELGFGIGCEFDPDFDPDFDSDFDISLQPSLPHLNFTATTDETTSTRASIPTQTTQHHPTANADDSSLSRKSSGESWDEGFMTAYPHAKTHPHVWVDARDRPGRDEQTSSDSGSGSGVGGRLDPGAGAGVGPSVHREAGTPTSGGFSVGQMSMPTGISFPTSASASSPPSPPSATAPANAPTAAPAKQAQAPAAQAQAQMARVASPTPTPHIARVSSPIARIASPTPSFSLPTSIRLAQQDMMESLHGHVRSDSYGHVRSESYGHVVGSGTGVGGSVLPYLVERDEEGSERHEHVEAEASTAVVNEDGHGHGVPRLQKPPVGLGVGLKMRMQTKANLNVDVARSPTVPEYPYTFPRVPPSPSCPASNPPAAWAGGAMSIGQTMDANGHLQAHIHDHDTGKDPTIAQNHDNTHGDGGGGGMNMNESMESAQKPPRSPLFDAGDPFRREGRGPQTQTQIRAPMSAPASVTTTPSRGLGVSRVWVWVCWGAC